MPTGILAAEPAAEAAVEEVVRVSGYTPWAWNPPTRARRAALRHFLNQEDPQTGQVWNQKLRIEPDNPLSFPGFSLKILNFSAGTGEEVVVSGSVHQFYQFRDQGFLMPLNPLIWEVRQDRYGRPQRDAQGAWDYVRDGAGQRKLIWKDWENIPPVYREMLMRGDDVMGIPIRRFAHGLLYRRDALTRAGFAADEVPSNWEELWEMCLRISATGSRQGEIYGLQLTDALVDTCFLSHGGDYARPDPETPGRWLATVDTAEMRAVIRTIRRLTLTRWVVDEAGQPVVVWDPDQPEREVVAHPLWGEGRWEGRAGAANARLVFPGRTFSAAEIRTGVAYNQLGGQSSGVDAKWYDLFLQNPPRLAFSINTPETMAGFIFQAESGQLGFAPVPAGPQGRRVFADGEIVGLNYWLERDPRRTRLAWAVASFLGSEDYQIRLAESYAREGEGIAETLPPRLLEQAGLASLAERVPTGLRRYWEELPAALSPTPAAKNLKTITQQYLGPLLRQASTDPFFDYEKALVEAQAQIQARLDFAAGRYERAPRRGLIVALMVALIAVVVILSGVALQRVIRSFSEAGKPESLPGLSHRYRTVAWLLLAPALLLITVFSYYPIFKALPIAFQDYRVTGETVWVGAANFVEVFSNPATWWSLLRTFYYLALTIGLGFFVPVLLAVLMSEIRSFRYLLRTVYYLPSVVAGIVMLLMWQRFYEPTTSGMVNQIWLALAQGWNALVPGAWEVAAVPVDWLRHPVWGIPAVVFVGIWGGVGPGMLIYLAALKSIPEDLYEAAEIDGASWWDRLRHITLSYLRPLLVINLVGAVIAAFQASGNILALSGNFPATYTFAVHVWFETFGLGNFGVGTALSWIMAALLTGFTLWQLRILRQVEFRRAEAD